MQTKKQHLIMAIFILVLCVLLFLQRLTGGIWHAVLGILLTVIVVVHLCRQNRRMKHGPPSVRVVDWALIALLAVLFVSGMLLHPLRDALALKIIHKLSAVLFVAGILVHIVQHRKSIQK